MKKKGAAEYTAEEFDAVVAMIRSDAGLRGDIEAITGQKLDGKTPRELFDLFRAIQGVTEVQAVVVRYGQARFALRQTRVEMSDPANLPESTAKYVAELQAKVDEEKAKRQKAEHALKVAQSRNVLPMSKAASA